MGFTELSLNVSEGQGSITITVYLTESYSRYIRLRVVTNDETANGEIKFSWSALVKQCWVGYLYLW